MNETELMLSDIPVEPYSTPGSGYFKIPPSNAFVCKTKEFLRIYPYEGGMIQVDLKEIEGDIAPFCG